VKKKQDFDYKEENYPVLILGTKNDRVEDRVIEVRDGIKVAEELGVEYAECSSKELGGGVEKAVLDLVRDVRESRVDEEVDSEGEERSKGMRKRADTWGSFIEVLEKIGSEHQK
jgi:GTPase SAR1 family protein